MKNINILIIMLVSLIVLFYATTGFGLKENYTDPIWSQPYKLYADYYPRSNGSLYGTPRDGWDIFSEIKYYDSAY